MSTENKIHIKLILLGDAGVGKTSIIQRYDENTFSPMSNSTYNANFIEKHIIINDFNIILELWDTAGQEEYRSVTKNFVKNSKIILLVYDITSLKSFQSLPYWYDFITKEIDDKVLLGLAGNKTDLIFEDDYEEEVPTEKGKEYAEKIGAIFSLISAKESKNEIVSLLNELISKYLILYCQDNYLNKSPTIKLIDIKLIEEDNSQCCMGKNKNAKKLKMVFIGCKGVGKTSIIKALKGNEDINNIQHTKKSYKETFNYVKGGENIIVNLKDTNGEEYQNEKIQHYVDDNYKIIFLIFNIYKKNTLDNLKNLVKNIDMEKIKVYLLGYNNLAENKNKNNGFDYENEAEIFAKKYGCKYEYISLENIQKVKNIIFESISLN